jgi:hypothetical protein
MTRRILGFISFKRQLPIGPSLLGVALMACAQLLASGTALAAPALQPAPTATNTVTATPPTSTVVPLTNTPTVTSTRTATATATPTCASGGTFDSVLLTCASTSTATRTATFTSTVTATNTATSGPTSCCPGSSPPSATAISAATVTASPVPSPTPPAPPSATGTPVISAPTQAPPQQATSVDLGAATRNGSVVPFTLPTGQQGQVTIDPNNARTLLGALPPGSRMEVIFDRAPQTQNVVQEGSLGSGIVRPLAPPVDLKVIFRDASGNEVHPPNAGEVQLSVRLPRLDVPPGATFAWLEAIYDAQGNFLGYIRPAASFDPGTGSDWIDVPASGLEGTLFLPASLTPAWVQNHDPLVHLWSGPTREARDFGFAGPQFTTFTVAAPQVTQRLFVYSPVVDNYGWIDASGVGPSGPPQ